MSDLILNPPQTHALQLLRALKGAPLSCLHALHIAHPRALGRADLMLYTGWKKDVISQAMDLLVNVYFFAARVARYESWCLTETGRQLYLPGLAANQIQAARAPIESDLIVLPSSSSSSIYIESTSLVVQETTTTTTNEGDLIALPENLTALFDNVLLGCPRAMGENAMRAALADDWTPEQIECELLQWVLYVESPLGRSINMPPARFAAAKIKKFEKCPDFFHRANLTDKQTGNAWEKWNRVNADLIRRAKTLLDFVYA